MADGTLHFSWRRLRALCRKETAQIMRDPSSLLIAVVIPLLLLFICLLYTSDAADEANVV